MKRILLLGYLLLLVGVQQSIAQCTPASFTTPGIIPDSATGLSSGMVGLTYLQVLQMRVPTDTTVVVTGLGTVTATIDSIMLVSFSALPPGLSYNTNPANAKFPGGTNGCVAISGTPTVAGTYQPVAVTKTKAHYLFINFTQYDTIDYYTINIANAVGLSENNNHLHFELGQNQPNPGNEATVIPYSVAKAGTVRLQVLNMLGNVVLMKEEEVRAGINEMQLDTRDLAPGLYIYSLESGKDKATRRMVISHK